MIPCLGRGDQGTGWECKCTFFRWGLKAEAAWTSSSLIIPGVSQVLRVLRVKFVAPGCPHPWEQAALGSHGSASTSLSYCVPVRTPRRMLYGTLVT